MQSSSGKGRRRSSRIGGGIAWVLWSAVTIGSVALKLLGLYCFTEAVPLVSYLAYLFSGRFGVRLGASELLLTFLPFAFYIGVGVALIWTSERLAMAMFARGSGGGSVPLSMPPAQHLQAIAISLLGLFTIVRNLPTAISLAIMPGRNDPRTLGQLIQAIAGTILGLAFFFGGKGLATLWHKLRTAGTPRA